MSLSDNSKYGVKRHRSFWKTNSEFLPGIIIPAGSCQQLQPIDPNDRDNIPSSEAFQASYSGLQNSSTHSEIEDDVLLLENLNIKLSRQAVFSAAIKVLQNHSEQKTLSNTTDDQDIQDSCELGSNLSSITSSTAPLVYTGHKLFGPGVGIRLDRSQSSETLSKFCPSMARDHDKKKVDKFALLLSSSNVHLDELKKISWSGIPAKFRPLMWKLFSGYMSQNQDRGSTMLERKRLEYHNFVSQYFSTRNQDIHMDTYRQIHIDIPRMSPLIPLFQQKAVQQIFERILYIWAIRHPASGYVQGINDLVTPFFVVFLLEYLDEGTPVESCQIHSLSSIDIQKLEADCFWCFSKLLDGIQDNYTFAQPGIQIRVNSLKELVSRIDFYANPYPEDDVTKSEEKCIDNLHCHLESMNIEYLQFAFRWMNNLLMREIPLRCVIRLWDTYMCEVNGFASFHLYVCVAFLIHFSEILQREHDFHTLLVLLQNLPTETWANEEIEIILAEAYRLKFIFADAPKHLH